jgi:hypothetical protein
MRSYPQQLFAMKSLATAGEGTSQAASVGPAASEEVGSITYNFLVSRAGLVPRIQPSVVPCLASAVSRVLATSASAPRAYFIVSGAADPLVNGVYIRLREMSAGAPKFAQLGRGVPVFMFKTRAGEGLYRWVIEQPHARVYESAARSDDEEAGGGSSGSGIRERGSLAGVASALGTLVSPRRLLAAVQGGEDDLAQVAGGAVDLPPVVGWSPVRAQPRTAAAAAGRLVVIGGDLIVRAAQHVMRVCPAPRVSRAVARDRIGTW